MTCGVMGVVVHDVGQSGVVIHDVGSYSISLVDAALTTQAEGGPWGTPYGVADHETSRGLPARSTLTLGHSGAAIRVPSQSTASTL